MADMKISGLTALTGANTATGDLLEIVDVSDTTMAATGTNKKITRDEMKTALLAAPGPIGGTTPGAGTFTTLTSTGNATLGDAEATDTHAIKGATTLLANSASAALTITQTGAGNAFVVEDVSPDSTPFVINTDGKVIIGGTATVTTRLLEIQDTGSAPFALVQTSDTATNASWIDTYRKRATGSVVQSGDRLGGMRFYGSSDASSTYLEAARILIEVAGTPGTNDMPGRLVFSTTADGASSPTERMRIDSAGSTFRKGAFAGANGYGFSVESDAFGATNNYGFYSNIASDVNRYNFYAAGSAPNYFAGVTGIGVAAASTSNLTVAASTTAVSSLNIPHGAAPTSPVNGDMWTTTAGLYVRINGATVGPLA